MPEYIESVEIIHEPSGNEPYVIVYKPCGLPSAPLGEDDHYNALAVAAERFPEINDVCGKKSAEKGLLHRLDTCACGLLLVASNQHAYDSLIVSQDEGKFVKKYRATCITDSQNSRNLGGFPPVPVLNTLSNNGESKFTIMSSFRPYGPGRKSVRPVDQDSGRAATKKGGDRIYETEIVITSCGAGKAHAVCTITAGYRHQVRCHLAWAGYPVLGDNLYNASYNKEDYSELAFEGFYLSFPDPVSGKTMIYEVK